MELVRKSVSELKFAPYNPRRISKKELEKLKKSISEFGYVEPIVWNKRTGHVVGGNQRLAALKELGIQEVEVVVVDLSLEEEKLLNLALNRIQGDWDIPKLSELIEELTSTGVDLSLSGFDQEEIDALLKAAEIPDYEELIEQTSPDELKEYICRVYYTEDRKNELIALLNEHGFKFRI